MVKRPAGGRWSWKGHGRGCCSQMMGTQITRAGQETEVLGSWLCHVIVCRFHLVMKSQDDLPFLFFETGSHSPGWPGTQYITETFDLLPPLPSAGILDMCYYHTCFLSAGDQASCIVDKNSASSASPDSSWPLPT